MSPAGTVSALFLCFRWKGKDLAILFSHISCIAVGLQCSNFIPVDMIKHPDNLVVIILYDSSPCGKL